MSTYISFPPSLLPPSTPPQDLIKREPHLFMDQGSEYPPMHQVGAFLSALFENSDLSTNSLKRRRTTSSITRSMSQQSTHILHSCQYFTPGQLSRMIISVFGGVPEPFEVFHCRPTATEEELRLFLNPKRATKHPFQYLILEVNKLPYQLQEVCVCVCVCTRTRTCVRACTCVCACANMM